MMPLLIFLAAAAQEPVTSQKKPTISIEAKSRSEDILKAFELLRKEKPTFRISARTQSGEVINNITEIVAMPNGTLLLLRVSTSQGTKVQTLSVDELQELFYNT